MNTYTKSIMEWIYARPVVSFILAFLVFLGYSNIFIFGYLINVPVGLRPFLDGYFFSSLALEFFMSVALAGVSARFFVLFTRFIIYSYAVSRWNFSKILFPFLTRPLDYIYKIIEVDSMSYKLDRLTKLNLRLLARWLRRNILIITIVATIVVFSLFFLGRQSLWYIPICLILLPLIWITISKVELRRSFATPSNTTSITPNRVVKAAIGFSVIYLAICVFIAGIASFHNRMETEVSVGVADQSRNSSLIAVTSSGVLVGEWIHEGSNIPLISQISVHFVPFNALSSVGQKH